MSGKNLGFLVGGIAAGALGLYVAIKVMYLPLVKKPAKV